MAAAVSLGMTRFAYALLLPPMRDDLSWTYTLAGAMNTFNALGYLLGALLTPWALRRWGAVRVLIAGSMMASILMALTGFFTDALYLLAQRFLEACWLPGWALTHRRNLACCWAFITAARVGAL
jgi:predicted MFS family arabinose efflux permease